ncbi:MAG: HDOD domain-containing protein [candidate division Zixibacteria bacterium]|nr:HDOD domain-containing protein [candidate division Zixibacteria bacterium]
MYDSVDLIGSPINSDLRQRIAKIETLPTLPEIYNQLVSELSSDNVSMKRVASIVSQDVAISAKLLQVVNSAFFGLSTEIQSVQQTVNYLGIDTVKGVVLSAGVYAGAADCAGIPGFSPAELYKRGVAVGSKARFIAYSLGLARNQIDNALTAGLLHDVGKLVLLAGFADEFKAACNHSEKDNIPLHIAEEKVLGANDAAIGGFLLSSWGLSISVIQAVDLHYEPSKGKAPELDTTAAVHLAYASEHNQKHSRTDVTHTAFDTTYTDALGITDQLAQFEDLTAEAVTQDN